ncbi:MAG: frk [Actinomycetia bacterium]|jgi:fructokinase|nr:frk [Actinomycetes bacterium]
MSHIAVIGEAVADAFPNPSQAERGVLNLQVRPGGSPVNTAIGLSRLGTPTSFLGRLAPGPFGDLIREHLIASRVDLTDSVRASEPATLAITAIDSSGQATYDFYADGTADWQWTREELTQRRPGGAFCVHTGSLALIREPGGPLIEDLLSDMKPHATISIDPNVRPRLVAPETYRAHLDRWTRLADIFRLSDEDFGHLYPDTELEQACDTWHENGVRLAVVTRGAEGAFASFDGTRITVPTPDIALVDTVGAGDAFTAGLLHWLDSKGYLGGRLDGVTSDDLRQAMMFATYIAAETCKVPGADPPWGDHLTPTTIGDVGPATPRL